MCLIMHYGLRRKLTRLGNMAWWLVINSNNSTGRKTKFQKRNLYVIIHFPF